MAAAPARQGFQYVRAKGDALIRSTASPPNLVYNGGPVISNVRLYQVLYGSGTYDPDVTGLRMWSFFTQLTQSAYMDWLNEYDTDRDYSTGGLFPLSGPGTGQAISRGSYAGQVYFGPSAANSGTTVDDTQIQAELSAQLSVGSLPAPDSNTLFLVYFPAGTRITSDGLQSCVSGGFCAYHSAFMQGGQVVYYGVFPDMSPGSGCDTGCAGATPFDSATAVASHEIIEAITDGQLGFGPLVGGGPPEGWYDAANGEVGDICNGQETSLLGSDGVTYTVQKGWSNADRACVSVSSTGAPNDFFIAADTPNATLGVNGTTQVNVSTSILHGSGELLSLSASGLPSGVSATFNPPTFFAGGSSTLTLSAGPFVVPGPPVRIELIAQGASATRANELALAISPIGFSNVPSDPVVEATSAAGAVVTWADPSAADGSTPVPVSCAPASGATLPLGVTMVTCTAQGGGTSAAATFTVTVRDTTGPVITVPSSLTVAATGPQGAVVHYSASARDAVDGERPVTCTPASGAQLPMGVTPVACRSVDSRGNPSQAMFEVSVLAGGSAPSNGSGGAPGRLSSPGGAHGCSASGAGSWIELLLAASSLSVSARRRPRLRS